MVFKHIEKKFPDMWEENDHIDVYASGKVDRCVLTVTQEGSDREADVTLDRATLVALRDSINYVLGE